MCVIIDPGLVVIADEVFLLLFSDESATGHFVLIHAWSWIWVFGWVYRNLILFTQRRASLRNS